MNPEAARFLMHEIAGRARMPAISRKALEEELEEARVPPNRVSPLRVHRFELDDKQGELAVFGALNVESTQAPSAPVYKHVAKKLGVKPDARTLAHSLLSSVDRRYQLYKHALHEYVLMAVETVFDRVLPDGQTLYRRTPRILGINNSSVRQWENRQSHLYTRRRFLPDMIYGNGRFAQ